MSWTSYASDRAYDEMLTAQGKPRRAASAVSDFIAGIGEAELRLGRPHGAIAPLQRALSLYEAAKLPPVSLAEVQFPLARALWSRARDRARARRLASAALAGFAEGGASQAEWHKQVVDWLARPNAS